MDLAKLLCYFETSPAVRLLRSPNAPFIVDFLYAYSFPKRPNMEALIKHAVIRDVSSAPRGFEPIPRAKFDTVLRLSETDPRLIVD